jgi:hypothetical protein
MDAAIEFLLEGDPAIRWQTMRDLLNAPPDDVAAERARVATEGWGARLLAEQAEDGRWDSGTYRPGWVDESRPFFDAWTATHFSLQALYEYGLDPESPQARLAVERVRGGVRWGAGEPYFEGDGEPCTTGIALASGAYFGVLGDAVVDKLLMQRLDDGGWNCDDEGSTVSSFHSTICVVEGLREWEVATRGRGARAEAPARRR